MMKIEHMGFAALLSLAAVAHASEPKPGPFPPCRNAADKCAPWERDWGTPQEDEFTPVIWSDDEVWSVQNKALAVRPDRQHPRGWVKVEYGRTHKSAERSSLTLYAFDCADQKVAILHRAAYDASGNIIESLSFRPLANDFDYIVPGTYIAKIAPFFCNS